jgi:hypothetical protein
VTKSTAILVEHIPARELEERDLNGIPENWRARGWGKTCSSPFFDEARRAAARRKSG